MRSIINFLKEFIHGNRFTAGLRILLGFMFLLSGYFKILYPVSFSKIIIMYNIIPSDLAPYAAIIMSALELILGILLITGLKIKAASFISMILMLMFTVFITVNVIRGETFDCHCFELSRIGLNIDESIGITAIIRDLMLAMFFLVFYRSKEHVLSVERFLERQDL